jgi:hypothetical protein
MPIPIPGTEYKLRLMDEVETVDGQYDVYDIGIEHPNGGIDSLAIGGSFYSLSNAIESVNASGRARRAEASDT